MRATATSSDDPHPRTILRPGFSFGKFDATGTPAPIDQVPRRPISRSWARCSSVSPLPSRRIARRAYSESDCPPDDELEEWRSQIGLELGPLIPSVTDRRRVLCLLWQYKHLNGAKDLSDLPCTDLIVHRVRLKAGTKVVNNRQQKRWPEHTEWWLRKLVTDGIKGGIYEYTEPANGRLSEWNARAVLVDKVEDPTPTDEPRLTFDYSRVNEDLPGSYLELSSKVHDNLSNPQHTCLFAADLKHAYYTIELHPDDRHLFAFTISGIGQLQPTRMPQGSQSAGFTMTELAYRAFGFIPPPQPEPSLLHSDDPAHPPKLVFYMDDFFGGFKGFEDQFAFLRDHFLPRIEWAGLRLSFKKLRLFCETIRALGVVHKAGGMVQILEDRIAKIMKWKVPSDQSGVRGFLGTIGITKRWVKNFAELSRPLTRLTGKVEWRWGGSEQLSFEILQIKCTTTTSMHGIDLRFVVHFYTDASGSGAGLAVTQFRSPEDSFVKKKTMPTSGQSELEQFDSMVSGILQAVEVPILYDSFTWTRTQKLYATYKKELCALVKFAVKYDYLCKHPYNTTIIHTDHRPLTHFLSSDLHEGIYGHWADKLRRLNVVIQYIPGPRNKVADGLSRALFRDDQCADDEAVRAARKVLSEQGAKWIWKDGKGGFEEFLRALDPAVKEEVTVHGTIGGASVFSLKAVPPSTAEVLDPSSGSDQSWKEAYLTSEWFGDVYCIHLGKPPTNAKAMRNALDSQIDPGTGVLWIYRRQLHLPCIPEGKVLSVLQEVHDNSGHWAKAGTLAKLQGLAYWPGQSEDVERYIAGCLQCARHGPATKSQPLHPITVWHPFQLMGMDFIGPLPRTKAGHTYILHLVCYCSLFSFSEACQTDNASDVIRCLESLFNRFTTTTALYVDRGQHFINQDVKNYLRGRGVKIDFSPSGSHKSTGLIEITNRLLEDVLKKASTGEVLNDWDQRLDRSTSALNHRIISYLGLSPAGILLGSPQNLASVDDKLVFAGINQIPQCAQRIQEPLVHVAAVRAYISYRAETYDMIRQRREQHKDAMKTRYDRGVKPVTFAVGDLVMLYQEGVGKLQPRWRGPFKVSGYGGHGVSFTIQQVNGRKVKGTFHGDQLKQFVPRSGYLAPPTPLILPAQQTIRRPRRKEKHPVPPPPTISTNCPCSSCLDAAYYWAGSMILRGPPD